MEKQVSIDADPRTSHAAALLMIADQNRVISNLMSALCDIRKDVNAALAPVATVADVDKHICYREDCKLCAIDGTPNHYAPVAESARELDELRSMTLDWHKQFEILQGHCVKRGLESYWGDDGNIALRGSSLITELPAMMCGAAEEARRRCREEVAGFMVEHSLATGRGDTIKDLLREIMAQLSKSAPSPELLDALKGVVDAWKNNTHTQLEKTLAALDRLMPKEKE